MADINIFVTDPSEERLSVLKEYAKQIGCITLPYGVCPDGLELPQAVGLANRVSAAVVAISGASLTTDEYNGALGKGE